MRVAIALFCTGLFICHGTGRALADEVTCAGIKRALVSANLALMRIERGPLPVAPVQAAIAIGQMTALMHVSQLACSDIDAGKIMFVVTPRRDALQLLLPTVPADTGPTSAPTAIVDGSAAPPMPPSDTRKQTTQKPAAATACERSYYLKGGHQFWRCKR